MAKYNSIFRFNRNYYNYLMQIDPFNGEPAATLSVWPRIYPPFPAVEEPNRMPTIFYKIYNPVGFLLFEILRPSLEKVLEIQTRQKIEDDLLQIILTARLGRPYDLTAFAYSDKYIIDTEKNIIYSPGPDRIDGTEDDIKMNYNPQVVRFEQ